MIRNSAIYFIMFRNHQFPDIFIPGNCSSDFGDESKGYQFLNLKFFETSLMI